MSAHDPRSDVLAAAAALVEAFGRHDTEAYFAAFAPDATFLFHTHGEPLRSRAAYEQLWATWEREDGFRVLSCESTDQHVQLLGADVAVFTHQVRTTVRAGGEDDTVEERETIVLHHRPGGRWVAVHEHLSPAPPS
ncbi:YybH family protein [Nocardioides sp. SYSU DS0663]|uniref:YybH family protein n=1 Tax=Nocardioides sp. SYSU DS0663 TaxID=3416445 RepID=UPI003F4BBC3F